MPIVDRGALLRKVNADAMRKYREEEMDRKLMEEERMRELSEIERSLEMEKDYARKIALIDAEQEDEFAWVAFKRETFAPQYNSALAIRFAKILADMSPEDRAISLELLEVFVRLPAAATLFLPGIQAVIKSRLADRDAD